MCSGQTPVVLLCFSILLTAPGFGSEKGSWPSDVPGWKPVAPGEHPRLFFRRSDLSELRRRAQTAEGKAILTRQRFLLDGGRGDSLPKHKNPVTSGYGKGGGPRPGEEELPVGTYSMSRAASYRLLYPIAGEQTYAELGRRCFELAFEGVRDRDREARYSFKRPDGALRAGPSLGWYAVGYDLCCDGWDELFRTKVAGW